MLSCICLDQKFLPHTFVLPPLLLVLNNEGIHGLLPDCYLTHRRCPSYEVEKTEMSGTEGLFELECKKDLLWVMELLWQ
jgi:hypothetical protein